MGDRIAVPTVRSAGNALKSFAWGGAAGLVYTLGNRLVGGQLGVLGTIIPAILAGSIIKGGTGEMVATYFGILGGMQLLSSGSTSNATAGVM